MELFLIMNWTVNGEVCQVDRNRMQDLSISAPAAPNEGATVPPDQVRFFLNFKFNSNFSISAF